MLSKDVYIGMKNALIVKILAIAAVAVGATYIIVSTSHHSAIPASTSASQVATISNPSALPAVGSSATPAGVPSSNATPSTTISAVPVTTTPNGANAGGANGSNGRGTKDCDKNITSVTMTPSYVAGSTPAGMSLDSGTYANANVTLATFELVNPSPCPMEVTEMSFVTHPTKDPSPIFTPLQNLRLMVAGTEFGSLVRYTSGWDETTDTWVTPADTIGSVTFSSTVGVIVPPHGSTDFDFVADGRNVPPPNSVQIQLTGFSAFNTIIPGMTDSESYPSTMALIESPVIPWSL